MNLKGWETVTINDIEYKFKCEYCRDEKDAGRDFPALKMELSVFKQGERMNWKDFKGSYAAQKIAQFVKNTINGQRSFNWKYKED